MLDAHKFPDELWDQLRFVEVTTGFKYRLVEGNACLELHVRQCVENSPAMSREDATVLFAKHIQSAVGPISITVHEEEPLVPDYAFVTQQYLEAAFDLFQLNLPIVAEAVQIPAPRIHAYLVGEQPIKAPHRKLLYTYINSIDLARRKARYEQQNPVAQPFLKP